MATATSGTGVRGPQGSDESDRWLAALRAEGPLREDAVGALHALLLRAARFEVGRRSAPAHRREHLDDLATQAANDALVSILENLGSFRRESRFTTWAYKFALNHAAVAMRRRQWQGTEVVLDPLAWRAFADPAARGGERVEDAELLAAVFACIASELSDRQRAVLVALVFEGVPIDVLAERLGTTRGALYKVLHDARRRLRLALTTRGFEV